MSKRHEQLEKTFNLPSLDELNDDEIDELDDYEDDESEEKLTQEEFLESFEISIKGCKDVYEMQKEALRKKYFDSEDEKNWK